ncbi:hypothetical protein BBB39_19690 [Bordetella trematum]|uniref:Protein of uncharacterized function (DUF3717) n=1 Tax=Bordetella trematum TaxID=123899 RepID=A0A157MHI7_9BORD|nr:DUF3717 domain-containing protein [Bordetella trematum]AUL48794.1 hypothetical protein BTL55_18820 [Bordetella trematum]AZR95738.1 hypothetical protein BBB39_19690 [Bordetella trematum]NNH18837.1 DUF3717 domain-containing protein [Bordetella trematum]QIM70717.1 DUF3717 domain-containing protein [Bordetella trematum]CZZ90848.1 Protein of uncharacterised function (DUF3717) [Bordetella trematum]
MNDVITLTDLEQAINYWRQRKPSQGEEARLCAEAAALATPYATLIMARRQTLRLDELGENARRAYQAWRDPQAAAGA